jgi:hypothetical protein
MSWSISSIECGEIPSSPIPGMSGDDALSICISSTWFRVIGGLGNISAIRANACQAANGTGINMGLMPAALATVLKKFLVEVDARATALERSWVGLRRLQHLFDRLPNIFHVDWLQSHLAGAEHWTDREPVDELEDSGEKCIIQPTAGRMIMASAKASRTANSPSPRFRI